MTASFAPTRHCRLALFAIATLLTLTSISPVSHAQSQVSAKDQARYTREYDAFLQQLISGDPSKIDFQEFRVAGVLKGGVDGSAAELGDRLRYRQLVKAGNLDEAYASATSALKRDFASAPNQYNAWDVCRALKKDDETSLHEKLLGALLDSIASHGDGKAAETAYLAVTTQEEYVFMTFRMHLSVKGQSLVTQNGHSYDRMEFVSPTGEHGFMWFLIDIQMGRGFAAASNSSATPTVIATATPAATPAPANGVLQYKLNTQGRPWNGNEIAVTRTDAGQNYHYAVQFQLPPATPGVPGVFEKYDIVSIYGFRLVNGQRSPMPNDHIPPVHGQWAPGDTVKLDFDLAKGPADAAQGWHLHFCAGITGRCYPSPNMLESASQ